METKKKNLFIFSLYLLPFLVVTWIAFRQIYSFMPHEQFTDEAAQTRFMSFATTIAPLRRLEVAKVNQVEVFERKSEKTLFWTRLRLPDVVISASVPVEYHYYVELNDEWRFNMTAGKLDIIAPPLRFNTPAPNISELQFAVKEGSLFRNESEVAMALKSELTERLSERAKESTHLARETARKELIAIAKAWLAKDLREGEQNKLDVDVHFSDEVGGRE